MIWLLVLCVFVIRIPYVPGTTDCDEYHTSRTGSISSLNYPSNYPSNSDCTYMLQVPGTVSTIITFNDFNLELGFDILYYGTGEDPDTSDAEGELSGYALPDPLIINSTKIWLRFQSDSNVPYRGFNLEWVSNLNTDKCKEPTSYPNATYTIDNTKYTEGTYAIYTCDSGHVMNGAADYIVHICREPDKGGFLQWEGPQVQCDVLTCPEPTVPTNGVITSSDGFYTVGAMVEYTCNSGFTLEGEQYLVCSENGTWSGQTPKCIVVTNFTNRRHGICAKYGIDITIPPQGYNNLFLHAVSCSPGTYKRYDDFTCYAAINVIKSWFDAKIFCEDEAIPYSSLAFITNNDKQAFVRQLLPASGGNAFWFGGQLGKAWQWDSNDEDIEDMFWAPGEPNNMDGDEHCINLNPSDDYRWNDEKCFRAEADISYFICQYDTTCPTSIKDGSTHLQNVQTMYESFCLAFVKAIRNKDDASYICSSNNGGILVEIRNLNMQTYISSKLSQWVTNGDIEKKFWWIGANADLSRKLWRWTDGTTIDSFFWAGSEPSQGSSEECLNLYHTLDYNWNDDNCNDMHHFICQIEILPSTCGYPGAPVNGGTSSSRFSIGDSITFYCNPGYQMQGLTQLTCQADGRWSDDVPICTSTSCLESDLPALSNGSPEVVSVEFRGVAIYRCDVESSLLVGDPSVYCNESSQWSVLNATCPVLTTTNLPTTSTSMTTENSPTTQMSSTYQTTSTDLATTILPTTQQLATTILSTQAPITTQLTTALYTTESAATFLATQQATTFRQTTSLSTTVQTDIATTTIDAMTTHKSTTEEQDVTTTAEVPTLDTESVTTPDMATTMNTITSIQTMLPTTSNYDVPTELTTLEIITADKTNLPTLFSTDVPTGLLTTTPLEFEETLATTTLTNTLPDTTIQYTTEFNIEPSTEQTFKTELLLTDDVASTNRQYSTIEPSTEIQPEQSRTHTTESLLTTETKSSTTDPSIEVQSDPTSTQTLTTEMSLSTETQFRSTKMVILTTETFLTTILTDAPATESVPLTEKFPKRSSPQLAMSTNHVTPTAEKSEPQNTVDAYNVIFLTTISLAAIFLIFFSAYLFVYFIKKPNRVKPTDQLEESDIIVPHDPDIINKAWQIDDDPTMELTKID